MTKVRGVLLDIDGTLIDSNDAHAKAWVEALKRGGYDVPYEKVRGAIGMGSDNLLPETVGVEKDTPEGETLSNLWRDIFNEKYLHKLRPFPGAKQLLERMREQGLKLVVASSAEEEMLKALLDILGATDLVEDQTSSDDADHSKPDPDIIQAALESIPIPAREVAMLGDTPYDIEAAGKAGVGVIAFRCGGFKDEALKGALAIYDGPADLLASYEESPLAGERKE